MGRKVNTKQPTWLSQNYNSPIASILAVEGKFCTTLLQQMNQQDEEIIYTCTSEEVELRKISKDKENNPFAINKI